MTKDEFFTALDRVIERYDLLSHPFYQAWAAGKLTREDLREYGQNYFHHIMAFPSYLQTFAARPLDPELRRVVDMNREDELGGGDAPAHAELWLDFVEGMGGDRQAHAPVPEIRHLTEWFQRLAHEGAAEDALAGFYAYESQVPRVAAEKERGLRENYKADDQTCGYFSLHRTADVYHSRMWKEQLGRLISDDATAERALDTAANAAQALWQALDGIEAARQARLAA